MVAELTLRHLDSGNSASLVARSNIHRLLYHAPFCIRHSMAELDLHLCLLECKAQLELYLQLQHE